MKTPEAYEKDDICKFLDQQFAWYFRPFMAGYGKSGISDIVACLPVTVTQEMVGKRVGVFVSIEVKREGGTPTKLQELRMKEIRKSWGFPFWGHAAKAIEDIKTYFGLQ